MAHFVHNNRKRSSYALDTALVELWRSFGSHEIDDDVRQLDWAPGCSQGPGRGGNLDFSMPPKPLRMRFCAQCRHCQGIHVVLCAAAGVQRLLHAYKRRGAGAPFCDLSGRKIGGDCSQKGAMGEQSGEEAPLHSIGRGLRSQCGAGDYSGRKFRPRPHTPSARTCTRWGEEIRFVFGSRFCLGLAVAVPDAPGSALAGCVVGVRI